MKLDSEKLLIKLAERRMTQAQVSEAAGLGRNYIANHLSKKTTPRRVTIFALAEALDCAPEEICADVEHVNK